MPKLLVTLKWEDQNGELQTLTDHTSINVRKGTDIKHNTMDVTLSNNSYSNRPYISEANEIQFEPDQTVELYARYDDDGNGLNLASGSSDLIFSGRVVEFEGMYESGKTSIKLACSDSTFIALNKLWVGAETDTPDELIKRVIDDANYTITDSSKFIKYDGGNIASTNSSGGAFSNYTLAKTYKPSYEVIQELSQPDATGDAVSYRFHVDKDNQFHWFYPDDTADFFIEVGNTSASRSITYSHPVSGDTESITDTTRHRVVNYKLKKAVYDIVNFIIYKAGEDLNGNQVLFFAYDPLSGSPVVKDSFRSWEHIARDLKSEEAELGNISKVQGDEYQIDVTSGTTSWGQAYSSSSDYNDKFITQARAIAVSLAENEFSKTGNPRWKGKIEVKGNNVYDANDLLVFTSDKHGIQKAILRITDVQHIINKNGWFTTLQVEEEIPKES